MFFGGVGFYMMGIGQFNAVCSVNIILVLLWVFFVDIVCMLKNENCVKDVLLVV